MNKRLICFSLTLLFVLLAMGVQAQQGEKLITANYSGAFTTAGLSNFIQNKNFDGLKFEGKYFLSDNFSLGVSVGWNDFKEKLPRASYERVNGSISSVRTYYFRTLPVLLMGNFYLASNAARFNPFVGIGIGGYFNSYQRWDSTYPTSDNTVGPGIRPEMGVLVRVIGPVGIQLKVAYNASLYSYREIDNIGYVEGNAGLYFRWR